MSVARAVWPNPNPWWSLFASRSARISLWRQNQHRHERARGRICSQSLGQKRLHLCAEILVLGVVLQFGNGVAHEHGGLVPVEGYLQAG